MIENPICLSNFKKHEDRKELKGNTINVYCFMRYPDEGLRRFMISKTTDGFLIEKMLANQEGQ